MSISHLEDLRVQVQIAEAAERCFPKGGSFGYEMREVGNFTGRMVDYRVEAIAVISTNRSKTCRVSITRTEKFRWRGKGQEIEQVCEKTAWMRSDVARTFVSWDAAFEAFATETKADKDFSL